MRYHNMKKSWLCITAKLGAPCPLWVKLDRIGRSDTPINVRFAPKADMQACFAMSAQCPETQHGRFETLRGTDPTVTRSLAWERAVRRSPRDALCRKIEYCACGVLVQCRSGAGRLSWPRS